MNKIKKSKIRTKPTKESKIKKNKSYSSSRPPHNSTPSLIKNHQSEVSDKENSPINNFHITKIKDCINEKYDHIALEHLKFKLFKKLSTNLPTMIIMT